MPSGKKVDPKSKASRIRREIARTIFRPRLSPEGLRDPKKRAALFSPGRIAKKLRVNESDVTSEMTKLRKHGMSFPGYLRSEKSKAFLIREMLRAGEHGAGKIISTLAERGVTVTAWDVGQSKRFLRKKGVPIPKTRAGRKPMGQIPKAQRIRTRILKRKKAGKALSPTAIANELKRYRIKPTHVTTEMHKMRKRGTPPPIEWLVPPKRRRRQKPR